MSFEATKQLRGARLLVEAMGMELDSISAYSSPSFDKIAVQGGTRTTDRVSQMIIRKESMIHSLMNAIEACQHLESASKAELETVHDLEMRAISRKNQLIYRENRANIGLTQEEVAYMERNNHKLKAGVYCRVSTQLEIQEGSLAWQRQHYFELLSNDPNIESVQVYCDEGFSGKYADRRPGFQQMLKDCEAGKIDVLYAKSISRFSRNLADCISTVRRLRTLGIPVLFEEEGINTMNIPSELLFHILSIVAQEVAGAYR